MFRIHYIVNEILEYLERKDEIREKLIKISREIIRKCRILVNRIHRRDLNNIEKDFRDLKGFVDLLKSTCRRFPDFCYSGIVQNALTEYYETLLLYIFISGKDLGEVRLSQDEYIAFLLGLADLVGELRRELVQALIDNKIDEATRYFNYIEQIYTDLSRFSFPNALIPGLRNKVDKIRYMIESSRNDILYVKKSNEVVNILSNVIEKREKNDK